MSQSNEDILRHFLALWAIRDAEGMVECFAEDGVYDNVPDRKPMVGRAAIKQWRKGAERAARRSHCGR